MNLNELQSVQSKERQTDSLQRLRDSFYQEVGRFVQQLKTERQEAAAAADDPFDSEEVQRLTDEIKTAEETVEAIYERRIGKLVKQASLEAAGMAADADGMTAEEREAFEDLVATIEENRAHVLGTVVGEDSDAPGGPATAPGAGAGDLPADVAPDVPPDVPPDLHEDPDAGGSGAGGVDATDAMGGGSSPDGADGANDGGSTGRDSTGSGSTGSDSATGSDAADGGAADGGGGATDGRQRPHAATSAPGSAAVQVESDEQSTRDEAESRGGPQDAVDETTAGEPTAERATVERATVERATVRITTDVGEILGVDERSYVLSSEDVVTLPEANAGPLVEKGAAERLD